MPEPTSEAWARIRYEYEHTTRPIEDICAEHGISSGTLRDRMRRWRWTRRRPPIPRDGPPPVPKSFAATPLPDPPPQGGREQAEFAAQAFVNSNGIDSPAMTPSPSLPLAGGGSCEAVPLSGSSEPAPCLAPNDGAAAPAAGDPASIVPRLQGAVGRVLPAIEAIIARLAAGPQHPREMEQAGRALGALMRTLRELNALLSQHNAQATEPYDDMPEDMDAFREQLARRIEVFMESRGDEIDEASAQKT